MLRGPDAASEKFLNDLAAINNRINRAQREITSGRRINAASDSPDEISYLLSLRSELGRTEQVQSNLSRVRTEVDSAEQALGNAVLVLDRIQVLGTQGASDIMDADGRRTLSDEVEQLLGQLVNLANSEIEGRFIFAGDTDQAAPFSFDPSQTNAVSAYQGSTTTRQVGHPSGSRFPISRTAAAIFTAPAAADNVFESVNSLRNALRSNNVDAVKLSFANVRTAAKFLNNQQAFYGGVQNQVNEAADSAAKQVTRLKAQISGVEDADITAAILDMNQARQLQETALAAESRRPRTTLFDYLR